MERCRYRQPPTINYVSQISTGDPPYSFNQQIDSKGGYKFFLPNTPIDETIAHKYTADSSTYATAANKANTWAKSVTSAGIETSSLGTRGAVYDAPLLWTSADRRRFSITLDLFSYDNLNDDIYLPIMFFRKFSYPDREGTTGIKILGNILYPCVFKITGGAFDRLSAVKEYQYYTLVNMSVKYNSHTSFFKKGIPMSATLILGFEEVINIYADMFQKIETDITIRDTKRYTPTIEEAQQTSLDKFKKNVKEASPPVYKSLSKDEVNNIINIDAYNTTKVSTKTHLKVDNGDITEVVADDTEKGNRFYEIKNINPDNTKMVSTSTSPSNLSTPERFALQRTQAVKLLKNAIPTLKAEAISAITNIVQKSAIYKTIDTILNTDPRHYYEVKKITKRSDETNVDAVKIPPIVAILRRSRG